MKKLKPITVNYLIQKFISVLIKQGKKALATKIIKKIFAAIYKVTNKSPLSIFKKAIIKGRPLLWYKFNNKKLETALMTANLNKKELAKARVKVYLIKNYDLSIFYFFSWLVRSLPKVDKEKNIVKRISKELIKIARGVASSFVLMHKKRMRFVILKKWEKKPFFFRFEKRKTRKLPFYILVKFYSSRRKTSLFLNRFIYQRFQLRFDIFKRFNRTLFLKKSNKIVITSLTKSKLKKQNKLYSWFIKSVKKRFFNKFSLGVSKVQSFKKIKLKRINKMVKNLKEKKYLELKKIAFKQRVYWKHGYNFKKYGNSHPSLKVNNLMKWQKIKQRKVYKGIKGKTQIIKSSKIKNKIKINKKYYI